jgi:phosphate-selective porin
MSTAAEKQGRQERILAELSELGLALARDLQARALAASDIAEASELGLAFQRVSRSVRQTLALEAKLERDRQRADREDRDEAQLARTAYAERRKAQVQIAVKRCVRYEHSGYDAENLLDELNDRLDEDALHDVFAGDSDIDLHIARMCAELGVPEPGADEASEPSTGAASTASQAPSSGVVPMAEEPEAQAEPPPDWRNSA